VRQFIDLIEPTQPTAHTRGFDKLWLSGKEMYLAHFLIFFSFVLEKILGAGDENVVHRHTSH
jgi:hypothetical protein